MPTKIIPFIMLCILLLARISYGEDLVLQDREIIRNGDCEVNLYIAWHTYQSDITSFAAKDGTFGLRLNEWGGREDQYAFQKLTIPTELQSATLRLDYRATEVNALETPPVRFQVSIAKSRGFDSANLEETSPLASLGIIHTQTVDAAFDWVAFTADLDPALVSAMQAAHADGEFVFLFLSQAKTAGNDGQGYIIDIDNVSLTVDGTQRVPEMRGMIAYLDETDEGDPYAISLLDPNTTATQTVWTHPDGKFDDWSNVAWKPDASEIAFVSDHDFAFYVFKANMFGIRPDGSGLHRIPSTPTQDDIEDGNYPQATVSGTLRVDTGDLGERYTIIMGIQGTDKGVMLAGSNGAMLPFTIPDVPILNEPNLFNQPLILQYYSDNCTGGIEYAFPIAQVVNGQADLGTVSFFGSNCIGILTGSHPHELTWKRDGSEIGFTLWGLKKVNAQSTNEFDITFMDPPGTSFSGNMAWSPVDDRYLYLYFSLITTNYELHLAEEGGEEQILMDDVEDVTPVWLPDGGGFIYVGWPDDERVGFDDNIFHYDLGTRSIRRLTWFRQELIDHISISPDGRHVVFQLRDERSDPSRSDLWIVDRLNPVELWPITGSGNCASPDWSRRDVDMSGGGGGSTDDPGTDEPGIDNPGTDNPTNNPSSSSNQNGSGGGGGGGCFLSLCR